MDPATIFMQYVAVAFSVWLLLTFVPSLLSVASRIGAVAPFGRRFAALAISVVLLAGVVRVDPSDATVGPASQRMVEMVDTNSSVSSASTIGAFHRAALGFTSAVHTVEPGDSLWRIARSLLTGDGAAPSGADISDLWRSIYEINRETIGDDPNLIHPGQVLQLPTR